MKLRLALLILTFLCGCSATPTLSAAPSITSISEKVTSAPTPTATATSRPEITFTPTPTATATSRPKITFTPTQTTDPVELLPTYEPVTFLERLIHDDSICKLPCWGNLIPGEVVWDTPYRYLRPLIDLPEDFVDPKPGIQYPYHNSFAFITGKYGEKLDASFQYDSTGLISLITTFRVGYQLQTLIQTYGRPDEFYFYSYQHPGENHRITDLFLYYPRQHFLAIYTFLGGSGKVTNFCSSGIERRKSPELMIWAGEKDFTSLASAYYQNSGLHNNIRDVKDYAAEEAIEEFFASTGEKYMCLKIGYPW